jgi:hypothetical protein
MPNARPMAVIASGVWELRVAGEDGIFRVFYYTASAAGVLVFHAFTDLLIRILASLGYRVKVSVVKTRTAA